VIQFSAKTADLSASVGVVKTLLYSSRIQKSCARKHNEPICLKAQLVYEIKREDEYCQRFVDGAVNFIRARQWRAEGGDERGDGSGHPMSEITKIKMLQLVNFSYCKITNARCMHLGVGRNFLHGGVNSGFSRGSQKDFAGVGQHDRISF